MAVHRFAVILALMVVSGCASAPVAVGPADIPARNPTAPFASTTRFDTDRFSGAWTIRQAVQPAPFAIALQFGASDAVTWTEQHLGCANRFDGCEAWTDTAMGRLTAPGRFVLDFVGAGEQDIWVLWVDEGYRTAALGSPDGRRGWVMDREAQGGEDRITAARKVLAFNGFDVRRLEEQ